MIRRFEILTTAGERVGEGVERHGHLFFWELASDLLPMGFLCEADLVKKHPGEIRYIDPPEGEAGKAEHDAASKAIANQKRLAEQNAKLSDEWPKPRKLPSSWVSDWVSVSAPAPFRSSGDLALWNTRGLLAYLDEQHREREGSG